MRLTIDSVLNRLDIAVGLAVSLQNQFGHNITAIYHLEDIENFTPEEIINYINDIYKKLPNKRILVFSGYIFTKYTFDTLYSFYNSDLNDNNYVIIFWEYPVMIFCNNKDDYKEVAKKLTIEQLKVSSLNVKDVIRSDNAVEIQYFTNSVIKDFEQRPIPMEKDFEYEKDTDNT